jgi:Mrp family chromosome partitioning ATPase
MTKNDIADAAADAPGAEAAQSAQAEAQTEAQAPGAAGQAPADAPGAEAQEPEDPSASCDNSCSSCGAECSSRSSEAPEKLKPHQSSSIGHVIAVVSGKGGVGKSLVTSLLALNLGSKGYKVGILDADITGPSIPRAFGVEDKLRATAQGILPTDSDAGISVVSTNLIRPEDTTPVIWRGAIISGLVRQFFSEVLWGELDYLIIDMPPGTGDVPLTVYQSLPIDGIVIVTAPQSLVSMIVGKAINMASMMSVPVLGMVENMSYFECPGCGQRHAIMGESKLDALSEEYGIDLLARLPMSPDFASLMDAGDVKSIDKGLLAEFSEGIIAKVAD